MTDTCERCEGQMWVCEWNDTTPWEDCDCGAPGIPCPDCNTNNPPEFSPGTTKIWDRKDFVN